MSRTTGTGVHVVAYLELESSVPLREGDLAGRWFWSVRPDDELWPSVLGGDDEDKRLMVDDEEDTEDEDDV